jgi:2-methylcitrate dehydratase PrpD
MTTNAQDRAPARGFSARLVADVAKISAAEQSETVLERVRQVVLDWLGVSIAGAQQPSAKITRRVFKAEGGLGVAQVIGTPDKLTARQAAVAVGVAGHALDFDDMGLGIHPSVAALPAIFAVGEEVGADGRTTVEAILQSFQTMGVISAACSLASYDRGFHCTGTFGAFGAAVGAGRLLRLDEEGLNRALGIAGTQAAGLKASFGTMSKHLNAGHSSGVGVLSARLAESGFTAAVDVIEGPQGFAIAHNSQASDFDPNRPASALGGRLAVEQVMFKPHAACGATHSTINGIRALKAQYAFDMHDVETVELVVSHAHLNVCGIPTPRTGLEGMFSLRYAAALALTGGPTGPNAFTDERVSDLGMIAARELVKVRADARIPLVTSPTEVTLRLKDGTVLSARDDALVVTPDDKLGEQWRALEAKFHELVQPVLGPLRSEELVSLVRRFETLKSIAELVALTTP